MPDAVYRKCVIELDIENGKFIAKARFLAQAGWRVLLGAKEQDSENDGSALPIVKKVMSCCVKKVKLLKSKLNHQDLLLTQHCFQQ